MYGRPVSGRSLSSLEGSCIESAGHDSGVSRALAGVQVAEGRVARSIGRTLWGLRYCGSVAR
jgi:hypothetical protein